jgi:hypothetical protein
MPTQVPPNRSFSVTRQGTASTTLVHLPALLEPPSTRSYQILALVSDAPATKLMDVYFDNLYDVREQDQLVDDADATKTYRVRYVETFDMPRVQYTFALVEALWGTN